MVWKSGGSTAVCLDCVSRMECTEDGWTATVLGCAASGDGSGKYGRGLALAVELLRCHAQ